MQQDLWRSLGQSPPEHAVFWSDPPSGLRAILVLDNMSLGPAAGGIRTRQYPDSNAALKEAARLARAMTLKCAISGLAAGGGKVVVIENKDMKRRSAFEALGRRIEALGGLFRTAGDLGTTMTDLRDAASHCQYVHLKEESLTEAVALGMVRCLESCARFKGLETLSGLRVAVQGCGAIGSATARALASCDVELVLADVEGERARSLARALGAEVVSADEILEVEVDIVAPCAVGGVMTPEVVGRLRAWGLCGAANNILSGPEAAAALMEREIVHVPDFIASAGAVIEGVGETIMQLEDRGGLIDRLGETTLKVLIEARQRGETPLETAERQAWRVLGAEVNKRC